MRRLLVTAIAAVGGVVAWRRVQQTRAEQELWAEATDPIGPPGTR